MSNDTITIPVKATMSKQPDGSFKMTAAEYATVPVDVVAALIAEKFGLTPQKER